MKFPKSMHADGWANHFDDVAAPVRTSSPKPGPKAGAKPVSAHTPLQGDPLPRSAAPMPASASHAAMPAVRPVASTPRSGTLPWVIGTGVGVLLIGGAVLMSRSTTHPEPATPVIVGQVTPSPEDAALRAAPPGTGVVTSAPQEAAPVPAELPAVKPAEAAPAPAETRTVKALPTSAPPAAAVAAAPVPKAQAPAPAVRTLMPQPEVLAQAAPQPVAPVPAAPAVAPPEAAAVPVSPPQAQQTPAAPDPVDAGITIQVRQALAADATLAAVPIAVSTDHGVVKLEGRAPDAQARERATVVAASTSGVKAVDNRLTLPPVASLDRSAISNGG